MIYHRDRLDGGYWPISGSVAWMRHVMDDYGNLVWRSREIASEAE